ncbi:hypothetical protein MKK65_00510 [Methylobacterium sp. J-001]|uniref:hypothetical protein n=1 Tax=Methylobacterium sp. J-001 TaxID=2836609 RepID=UPI001FBB6B11|nr:hypothetical protein [Methylobacterium sp. J-001]MCJ2115092.1 hypothetical protein [Methylobacterium sp. J-001]
MYQAQPKNIALIIAMTANSFVGMLIFAISSMAAPLGAIPIELARRIFFYRPGDKSDFCGIDGAFEPKNGRFFLYLAANI